MPWSGSVIVASESVVRIDGVDGVGRDGAATGGVMEQAARAAAATKLMRIETGRSNGPKGVPRMSESEPRAWDGEGYYVLTL